jgi:small subunit ribosomal protein S1
MVEDPRIQMNSNSPVPPPELQESAGATTDAAQSDASFGDILFQFEQQHQPDLRGGETLQATVVAVTGENVYVDVGRKMEGLLPVDAVRAAGLAKLKAGDPLIVTVTGRNQEGYYLLSTQKVEVPKDWSALENAYKEKHTIVGRVVEAVKGGLRVDVGVRAFMPASRSGARDQAEVEKLIGQEIQCRITKLDTAKEDVVVDRRVVLEEDVLKAKQQRFAQINEGDVVRGTVRTVTDFGAFVDLGGFDGLLHVADMSWGRVGKPADVVKPGDSIEVKVLKVNRETRKISLGLKQLAPDPWTLAGEKYKVGDRLTGTVSRLTDFGAFVELDPGIDGLIHLSEMSWSKKIRKPADLLKVGDQVEAVVLAVNTGEHRIGLGLKQALGDPWEEAEKKFAVGSIVEGAVTSLQKFGAFIDLGDGIEGMIHIGDISREKRLEHPNEVLKAGQTVRAQVLELDKSRRRIRLGMKQLEPTSVDEYIAEHQNGEVVSGRLIEVSGGRARVELGEGVFATCKMKEAAKESRTRNGGESRADLSAMTAMLSARWKAGAAGGAPGQEQVRPGQVRSFRITLLDPAHKKIEVELAG